LTANEEIMGRKHYGHSDHSHHHHHKHDWSWDHHHGGHDYMFGTRAEDVLNGGPASDIIFGLKGNDEIDGGAGNDWLIGGRGDDLLSGGAGSDKVFGGKGDDVLVYTAAENASNGGCSPWDFYDGGKGYDVLKLCLTAEEMADPDVQADIAAFQDFLGSNHGGCGHNGVFKFGSLDLYVRGIEELVVDSEEVPPAGNNEAPQGNADSVETLEDVALVIDVLANDTDADSDPLTAVVVDGPAHGTLVPNPDGTFTYTPEADFNGTDGFTYRASDGVDESGDTNVAINVTPVNDAPEMVVDPDWGPIDYNGAPVTIKVDILSYYSPGPADESGQTMDFELEDAIFFTTYGVAGKTPDGLISYTALSGPAPGGVLTDSFEYIVMDDAGGFTTAAFEVDIV
jgi:hypothetical protein